MGKGISPRSFAERIGRHSKLRSAARERIRSSTVSRLC